MFCNCVLCVCSTFVKIKVINFILGFIFGENWKKKENFIYEIEAFYKWDAEVSCWLIWIVNFWTEKFFVVENKNQFRSFWKYIASFVYSDIRVME